MNRQAEKNVGNMGFNLVLMKKNERINASTIQKTFKKILLKRKLKYDIIN